MPSKRDHKKAPKGLIMHSFMASITVCISGDESQSGSRVSPTRGVSGKKSLLEVSIIPCDSLSVIENGFRYTAL